MADRFKAHIETALASLEQRIDKARKPLDRGAIERQIGRLLGRNSRAAGAFSILITEDATHPSGIKHPTRTAHSLRGASRQSAGDPA